MTSAARRQAFRTEAERLPGSRPGKDHEWAADQDPGFRRIFYRELLPELKRQGKTLIVISHDDRFFDAADRVVSMTDGRIMQAAAPELESERAAL